MPDTPRPRTLEERAAFLCRTPEELAQLDAVAGRVHAERAAAPDLADRYNAACERVTELHQETVKLRRRVEALETRLEELDADLQTATHFLVGRYRVGRRHDHWEVWPEPSRVGLAAGRDYDPVEAPTRDEALATARRLVAKETHRG